MSAPVARHDGVNDGAYGSCDRIVQSNFGEQCDDGIANGAVDDPCTAGCMLKF